MGRCQDCKCFIVWCLRGDRCKRCARIHEEAEELEEQKRINADSVSETPSEENATILVEGVETSVKLIAVSARDYDEGETRRSEVSAKEAEEKYAKAQVIAEQKDEAQIIAEQKRDEAQKYAEQKRDEAQKYAEQKRDEAQKYAEAKKKAEEQKRAEFLREWGCMVDQILGGADLEKNESDHSLFGTKIMLKAESFAVSIGNVSMGEYVRDPPEVVVIEDTTGADREGGSMSSEDGSNNGDDVARREDDGDDSGSADPEIAASAAGPSGISAVVEEVSERRRLNTVVYLHKWGFNGEAMLEYLRATRHRERCSSSESLNQVEKSRHSQLEKLQRRRSIGYLWEWGFTPEQVLEYIRLTEPKERIASWRFSMLSQSTRTSADM